MAEPLASSSAPPDTPVLRVRCAADLVEAVPYLLGFRPLDSAVLVGLDAPVVSGATRGRVTVVARMDLDGLEDPVDETAGRRAPGGAAPTGAATGEDLAANAVGVLLRAGSVEAIGIVYADGQRSPDTYYDAIRTVDGCARRAGLEVAEWLVAVAPVDAPGDPRPVASSRIAAEATYAGLVARPDRASLAALLEPRPDAQRTGRSDRLDVATAAHRRAERGGRAGPLRRSAVRALFAASRRLPLLEEEQLVRFGAALRDSEVRDACWLAIEGRRVDGEDLWRELAQALPGPYAAAPAFLFGWRQWRGGHGALAAVAVERALAADPEYRAAHLLDSALSHGLDPFRTPRLRKGV
ncbi:MAG: DUF4192 domain-containing protein [bacterium]